MANPKILVWINWTSDASGGTITVYDGKDTNGTIVHTEKGAASVGTHRSFGANGVALNGGIYVAADGHVTRFTVGYQELI